MISNMPDWAEVGKTVYIEHYMHYPVKKTTVTKVTKTQVTTEHMESRWRNGETVQEKVIRRWILGGYGNRLKEHGSGNAAYRRDHLISEQAGLQSIEADRVKKAREEMYSNAKNAAGKFYNERWPKKSDAEELIAAMQDFLSSEYLKDA